MHHHEKRRMAQRRAWVVLLMFALFAFVMSLMLLIARIAAGE